MIQITPLNYLLQSMPTSNLSKIPESEELLHSPEMARKANFFVDLFT